MKDGSILAPGLRADEVHVKLARPKTDLKTITAFRLELLNDPNLPLQRARPVVQGDAAP